MAGNKSNDITISVNDIVVFNGTYKATQLLRDMLVLCGKDGAIGSDFEFHIFKHLDPDKEREIRSGYRYQGSEECKTRLREASEFYKFNIKVR